MTDNILITPQMLYKNIIESLPDFKFPNLPQSQSHCVYIIQNH